MKRLIIKTSALGDVVQTLEAAAGLPKAEVDWVVEAPYESIVKPFVNRTLVVDTKKWRRGSFRGLWTFIKALRETHYDKIIDLQGNLKSSLILAFARGTEKVGFGWGRLPEKINGFFTDRHINPPAGQNIRADYRALLELPPKQTAPFKPVQLRQVMVASGSAWKNKQLPIEVFIEFLKHFQKENSEARFNFIWGTEAEKSDAEILAAQFEGSIILPKLSLDELSLKMKTMDYFIGMDSFPLHLAGLVGLPALAFFGPSSAAKYAPEGALVFQGPCPYGRTFEKRCPILRSCPTGACLRKQSAQTLWDSFK